MNVQIEASWKQALAKEFEQPYFAEIVTFLKHEKASGKIIYPAGPDIFNAFTRTPFNQVKVVILGQDPYHGPQQAHGLCFSVQKGVKPPPSLVNIFKELSTDIPNFEIPNHGCLSHWASQGILMLNSALTVVAGQANSHAKIGWERFTDAVIRKISEEREGVVFLLWGRFAQQKAQLVDAKKHHLLMAPHPSPFSAHSGFLGCKHFSKTNELLRQQGKSPIDWNLPNI
jgi:uracil-DNA glycosylase